MLRVTEHKFALPLLTVFLNTLWIKELFRTSRPSQNDMSVYVHFPLREVYDAEVDSRPVPLSLISLVLSVFSWREQVCWSGGNTRTPDLPDVGSSLDVKLTKGAGIDRAHRPKESRESPARGSPSVSPV